MRSAELKDPLGLEWGDGGEGVIWPFLDQRRFFFSFGDFI